VKTPRRSARWFFMASNTDLLDDPGDRAALAQAAARRMRDPEAPIGPLIDRLTPEGRSLFDLLTATDPDRVDDLIARLPATARRQLDDLSPRNMALSRLAGRLILIHGAEDTLVPYTESLAIGAAATRAELFIVDDFSHIDPSHVGLAGRLTLIDAVQAVLRRRH
jgi:pimeloyl-ACP methyl ester carboxylesterase